MAAGLPDMVNSTGPRRRFAPVHIETTFERVRVPKTLPVRTGPNPELTPDPSPRSSPPPEYRSSPLREKRRFAPQLIESSRRARRVGDVGPATRPADKTDITPYTNHIYIPRARSKRRIPEVSARARRESEDEETKGYLLDLAAREAERQMREAALAAFPNSGAREGGVAHFYFRDSEEYDTSPETTPPAADGVFYYRGHHPRVLRRKSTDLGWWHKHMQEHADAVARERGEEPQPLPSHSSQFPDQDSDYDEESELGDMEDAPEDPLWMTERRHTNKISSQGSLPGPHGPIGESYMPLIAPDPYVTAEHPGMRYQPPLSSAQPIGESHMPYVPSTPAGHADVSYLPPTQVPPETDFRSQDFRNQGIFGGGFGRPFGRFAQPELDGKARRIRTGPSPPMLGEDLTFRRCPSPKQTKMEPEHLFPEPDPNFVASREPSGDCGLWRGYCYRGNSQQPDLVPSSLHGPKMIDTPLPPATPAYTPHDPFSASFGDELWSPNPATGSPPSTGEHRLRGGDVKGLHMLHGLEERLRVEKAAAEKLEAQKIRQDKALEERNKKIAAEFTDDFVTQVFNYLSLGYPATARSFDDELSKISGTSLEEITRDDETNMATGHVFDIDVQGVPEEKRSPRWRALKIYIYEWARQHPDLDGMEALGWGVRERRGSWAV